jgi:hypothetical protein
MPARIAKPQNIRPRVTLPRDRPQSLALEPKVGDLRIPETAGNLRALPRNDTAPANFTIFALSIRMRANSCYHHCGPGGGR